MTAAGKGSGEGVGADQQVEGVKAGSGAKKGRGPQNP